VLCAFFVGRGLVCHPLLALAAAADEAENKALAIHAATSLIGLGMTNLSGVLALQLNTLDTLMLCAAHLVASACWILLTFRTSPSGGEGWHTLLAGHSLVACVCVWQQHEQERLDRSSFEEELLMERGLLLRSADCLARQSTEANFAVCLGLLHRARRVEHLRF